jgi:glyoxylase-like metal-dependent hydrolase (beta-lactamase superfamily II)
MTTVYDSSGSHLRFQVFTGHIRALASNAVLITGRKEAILVDTLFLKEDAEQIIAAVRATGKELTSIYITHAHPDHYFGLPILQQAFPKAQVYARATTVEFQKEFAAKILHWQEMYPGELPTSLTLPHVLLGDTITLEGEEIRIVDLEMVETTAATAFYIPSAKTLIAADLIYSKSHHYMGDVGRADTWIDQIGRVDRLGVIDRVIPGHGPVGGRELFDESIDWLTSYEKFARPGVRFTEIAKELVEKYPTHGLSLLLYLTRGPGFGAAGAKEVGAPSEIYAPGMGR